MGAAAGHRLMSPTEGQAPIRPLEQTDVAGVRPWTGPTMLFKAGNRLGDNGRLPKSAQEMGRRHQSSFWRPKYPSAPLADCCVVGAH